MRVKAYTIRFGGSRQPEITMRFLPVPARATSRIHELAPKGAHLIEGKERKRCGSRAYKPNSVRLAAGRPFLWASHCYEALATYPEVVAHRAGTHPPSLPFKQ